MEYLDTSLVDALKKGSVVVMPTDTIYGLVGRADMAETVERIYEIRRRSPDKPCIVLIGNIADLQKFNVAPSAKQREELAKYWPGPVSVILDCRDERFAYLHRGTKTLAFRMPADEKLRELLSETGPLLAPSANIEGLPPAITIAEAKAYFGDAVDFYADGGAAEGKPSKILRLHVDGSVTIIRE